ncbi:BREX system ATP-binding domain-containing protein [Nostoc sp. PA-18-2419]|uniref:BREX system ATP-binding domain-containing protein n=1 Tax=Nostoc sp. PA-18-2419 TaxID=2575443 RepID=UPI00110847C6|nr:BREX system ATP-binding domain-containing protein [Nostoc sp. PA-18-2419]
MVNILTKNRTEIKRILKLLEATLVPESGLELFTVGDGFRRIVSQISNELSELSKEPQFREYIIEGSFGGGKTHFLKYISWLISENESGNRVVSSLDMSNLSLPGDFEHRVVRGMYSGDEKNYGEVLRNLYKRIVAHLHQEYVKQNINIYPDELEKIFETLLYFIIGTVSAGTLDRSIIELLGNANPVSSIVRILSRKTISSLALKARHNSSANSIKFVETYISIIKNENAPLSRFDEACISLGKEKELCNVIFRMLKLAGYNSVIILVDELETIKRFREDRQRQILTEIREFRDRFSLVGEDQGFPSTALLVASTSQFSSGGALEQLEPALQDRWKRKKLPLIPLSESDIDHLLFRLRDLFYFAGYKLKPLDEGDIHEIITMRRKLFNNMTLVDRNPRNIIAELIKMIREEWIVD